MGLISWYMVDISTINHRIQPLFFQKLSAIDWGPHRIWKMVIPWGFMGFEWCSMIVWQACILLMMSNGIHATCQLTWTIINEKYDFNHHRIEIYSEFMIIYLRPCVYVETLKSTSNLNHTELEVCDIWNWFDHWSYHGLANVLMYNYIYIYTIVKHTWLYYSWGLQSLMSFPIGWLIRGVDHPS